MSITPADLLAETRELLVGSANEVRRRTVASRAYYAAFHASRRFAATLGYEQRRDRGVHGQLIRFLANRQERWIRGCARRLRRLRDLRTKADYQLEIRFPFGIAQDAVEDAIEIMEDIVTETA